MRQILFRGKCKQSKEWVYGDLIHGVGAKNGRIYILPNKMNLANVKHCDPLDGVEIEVETIGQFSGILDKNGEKAFEGDIVKIPLSFCSYEFTPPYRPTGHDGYGDIDCIGNIIFIDGSFKFHCDLVLRETSPWHDEYNLTKHFQNRDFDIKKCLVIGNIHDNNLKPSGV